MDATARAGSQDVIVADVEDDLGSLRSKIESTAADQIFLVLPREASALRTPVAFRVFARMLEALASDVVIVSGDGERRRLARLAGFRTRRGLRGLLHLLPPAEAERFRFRWYRVWRWFPVVQLVTLLIPTLVVIGLATLVVVLLPELRITMEPATDVDSALLEIRVDPNARNPDVSTRRLPARVLGQSFEVEVQVDVTGVGRRPKDPARGTVTFVNTRENLLIVPQGFTLVSSNGVQFKTEEEVRLPPNTLVGLRVNVQAIAPGPQGNVAAMAITRPLEAGPPGLGIFNERPTEGGSEEEFPQVSERDFITLRAELQRRAQDTGWLHLMALAGDEWGLVPDTMRVDTESESFSPGLRAESAMLTGRLTARVSALGYGNGAFNELAEAVWAASVPAGFRPTGTPVELTVPEYLGQDGGWALYRIGVRGRIAREMDGAALAARLRGATVAEAHAALATRNVQGTPVQVEIWPSWAPRAFRLRLMQTGAE
jgi:hypothetical protein